MKILRGICVALALLIGSQSWASTGQSNMDSYAHLTQDSIALVGNDLAWNGVPATADEIQSKITSSYSLQVSAYNPEFNQLMTLLQIVKDSGIEDRLILLSFFEEEGVDSEKSNDVHDLFTPDKAKIESASEPMTVLKLENDGQLLLSDEPVELADLAERLSADDNVGFWCIGSFQFSRVYEVLQAFNHPARPHLRLTIQLRQQIMVKAKVVEILDDGTENILSAPFMTTESGYMASMGVRDTQPQDEDDLYQQNGRSGGGVSLKILPQAIGNYIKVSGSVSLKRVKGSEAFKLDNEPIHNYSAETIVIPFAYALDEDTDTVTSDPIVIGDKKIVISIQAYPVSETGERISSLGQ